ncbi:hypothetical protein BDP27DRAFT_308021 [Rhodocollybia butyracea]|uniref:Uncharacterized protein n=1 Tax=Rhodocollybia butyracea TaxID=206335 RepID=A0A9P5PAI8_9AGAR|nr:hypothetical protein BDP27DRAFT_308021 [Rhodocollybia butyracea]
MSVELPDGCICLFAPSIRQSLVISVTCSHSFDFKCLRPLLETTDYRFTNPVLQSSKVELYDNNAIIEYSAGSGAYRDPLSITFDVTRETKDEAEASGCGGAEGNDSAVEDIPDNDSDSDLCAALSASRATARAVTNAILALTNSFETEFKGGPGARTYAGWAGICSPPPYAASLFLWCRKHHSLVAYSEKKREERRSQVRPFADQCSVSWFNHEGISCLFNHPKSGRHLNGVALQKRYSSSAIFTSMPLRDTYASVMTAGLYALRCFSLALTVTFILNSTFQNFMVPPGEHRMFLSWYQLASIAILALNPRDEWVRNVIITFLQQFIRNL